MMEVHLVKSGMAAIGKPANDVPISASAGEHGVKGVANLFREPGDLASRTARLNHGGTRRRRALARQAERC